MGADERVAMHNAAREKIQIVIVLFVWVWSDKAMHSISLSLGDCSSSPQNPSESDLTRRGIHFYRQGSADWAGGAAIMQKHNARMISTHGFCERIFLLRDGLLKVLNLRVDEVSIIISIQFHKRKNCRPIHGSLPVVINSDGRIIKMFFYGVARWANTLRLLLDLFIHMVVYWLIIMGDCRIA